MKVTALALLTYLFSVGRVAAHPVDRLLKVGQDISDDEKDELLLQKILEDLPEPEFKKTDSEPTQHLRKLQPPPEPPHPEDVQMCTEDCGSCSPCFCQTRDFKIAIDLYHRFPNEIYQWGRIEDWCTGRVQDMSESFRRKKFFNADITGWDTGKVINFSYMFDGAERFNQAIGVWNTESAENMDSMFHNAFEFNQPIENWDVSKVYIMRDMFHHAHAFNQPLERWDVRSNHYFSAMFSYAKSFNQPLNGWGQATSEVWFTSSMFYHADEFNQDLDRWNMQSNRDMTAMFYKASKFNGQLPFRYPLVRRMWLTFGEAKAFNQDIGRWFVGAVTTFESMFEDALAFNQDISGWNFGTAEPVNIHSMFFNAQSFNQNMCPWIAKLQATGTTEKYYEVFRRTDCEDEGKWGDVNFRNGNVPETMCHVC